MFSYVSVHQSVSLSTAGEGSPHMTITHDALDLTLQPLANSSPLDMTLGNSPSFNPGPLLATSCSHWTSVQICSLDLTVQPPSFPRRQHLAVSSETGTNCKRAVHILPECFLVVCVVLLFKLSLCNSNVSYCSSNIQTIDRSKGTLRANDGQYILGISYPLGTLPPDILSPRYCQGVD